MRTELIFTRFFPPMADNWETYLKSWDRVRTAEEAAGLLYAGVSHEMFRHLEYHQQMCVLSAQERAAHDKELKKRLEFYLAWAKSELNPAIAIVAQQIIVKYWMRICKSSLTPGSINFLLIDFLRNIYLSLMKPPYPRFVGEYLLWLFEERPEAFFISTSVPMFINWGMGYILANKNETTLIPYIEAFLNKDYDAERFILNSLEPEKCEPLNSLEGSGAVCQNRAGRALIKLKMRAGYGLTKLPD